jgi:hypothetical protein
MPPKRLCSREVGPCDRPEPYGPVYRTVHSGSGTTAGTPEVAGLRERLAPCNGTSAVRTPSIDASPVHRGLPALAAAVALLVLASVAAAAAPADDVVGVELAPARTAPRGQGALPKAPDRPLRITISVDGYTDKGGVYFVEPRLVGSLPAPFQTELRVGASYLDAGLQLAAPAAKGPAPRGGGSSGTILSAAPGRSMAGASLSVPWSVVRATLGYAVFFDSQSTLQDREAALSVKPFSALEVSGALRHRPFVEMAEPLAVDDQVFYTAGPAGAMSLLAAWPLTVDEVRAVAKISPASWAYLYADGRSMSISDGNRGWNLSAGAGASLQTLLHFGGPVDVTPRWDTWAASYSVASPAYYSPSRIVSHSPGLEVRFKGSAFELAAEGGITFAPGQSFTGQFGGASALLRLGRLSAVARAQVRSDPWFASRKAWMAVQSEW